MVENKGNVGPTLERVTEKDLNLVQQLNASGSISYKGNPPTFNEQYMQNALSPNKLGIGAKVNYGSDERIQDATKSYELYLWFEVNRICSTMFDYENIPKEIDINGYERKIVQNGSAYFVRVVGDKYAVVQATALDWDIYDNPTAIQVTEPHGGKQLNNKKFKLGEFVEIKSNSQRMSVTQLYNFIVEKLVANFHRMSIETFGTLPKKFIIGDYQDINDGNQVNAENQERFIRSSNMVSQTIFDMTSASSALDVKDRVVDVITPQDDKRDKTIAVFEFLQNQFKDCLGISQSGGNDSSKDRTTVAHVESAQGVNESFYRELFNSRKEGWDKVNEIFGLNVEIIDPLKEQEEKDQEAALQQSKEGGNQNG